MTCCLARFSTFFRVDALMFVYNVSVCITGSSLPYQFTMIYVVLSNVPGAMISIIYVVCSIFSVYYTFSAAICQFHIALYSTIQRSGEMFIVTLGVCTTNLECQWLQLVNYTGECSTAASSYYNCIMCNITTHGDRPLIFVYKYTSSAYYYTFSIMLKTI